MHMLELLLLGLEFDSFETETDGRFYLSSQTAIWRKILPHASPRILFWLDSITFLVGNSHMWQLLTASEVLDKALGRP